MCKNPRKTNSFFSPILHLPSRVASWIQSIFAWVATRQILRGLCATGLQTVYLRQVCSQYQDRAEGAVVISTSESGGAVASKCFMELFNTLQSRSIHYPGAARKLNGASEQSSRR